MLTINNINDLLGKKFVLDGVGISDEHRVWECIEAIEFNTDYGTNDTFFYRFEFYNENDPNFPLCVYVNRNASLGQYLLENNLMNTSACLSLSELCALYSGKSVNDEVYQIIFSIKKSSIPFTLNDVKKIVE